MYNYNLNTIVKGFSQKEIKKVFSKKIHVSVRNLNILNTALKKNYNTGILGNFILKNNKLYSTIKVIIVIVKDMYLILKGILFVGQRDSNYYFLVTTYKILRLYYIKKLLMFYYYYQPVINLYFSIFLHNLFLYIFLNYLGGYGLLLRYIDYIIENHIPVDEIEILSDDFVIIENTWDTEEEKILKKQKEYEINTLKKIVVAIAAAVIFCIIIYIINDIDPYE